MTIQDARELLRVSKAKMARLLADGVLQAEVDPLDKRFKLVDRAAVEQLREKSEHPHPQRHKPRQKPSGKKNSHRADTPVAE